MLSRTRGGYSGLAVLAVLGLLAWGMPAAGQEAVAPGPAEREPPRSGPARDAEVWPEHAMPDEEAAAAGRSRLPFTQEQIELLGRLLEQTQRATARARGAAPLGRVRRIELDGLGPGAVQEVAVHADYVTSVGFYDRTGAPWPIARSLVNENFVVAGGEGAPEVGHLLHLKPNARWLTGNASVMLEGLAEPLILVMSEGDGAVDFSLAVRLPEDGPNADPLDAGAAAGFHAGSGLLLGLLSGEAPARARALDVEGIDGRAWRLGEEVLLVTRAHLVAPGPRAAERDPSGRWAYRLPGVPYAMVSVEGRELRASFLERPETPRRAREN